MAKIIKALFLASILALSAPALAQTQDNQVQQTGLLLVVGKSTDRARIGGYVAALPPLYAAHNAYYLALGSTGRGITWLEGTWQDRSLVLARFPSRAEIDTFWWGEPYRSAIRKRDNAGVFSVVALTSTAPLILEGADTGYLIVMTGRRDNSQEQARQSDAAASALRKGVTDSGGVLLTSTQGGPFTLMEGDSVFDRFIVAAWPSLAARDAYLSSRAARQSTRMRQRLGMSVVASANGTARIAPKSP